MLGFNGGLIGAPRAPTSARAPGLWLPNEQSMARRSGTWPIGAWTPESLPPTMELWLDFADASTVTATGTAPGSDLLQVNDKSGNGRHAVRSGRPETGIVNGKACMVTTSFSGVRLASRLSVLCFVAVIKYANTTALQFIAGDPYTYDFHADDTYVIDNYFSSGAIRGGSAWKNGNSVAPTSITRNTDASCYMFNATGYVSIQYFSEDRSYGRSTIGSTCEIFAFSAHLSSSDRLKLEGFLAHKWGFVSSLPSNHLYLETPP